jgi:hypothetical protein
MNPSPEQEIESRHWFGDSLSFKCHFANNLDLVGDKREWAHEYLRIVPKMRIVREHDEEVFIVLARNHRVEPVDASGKKCHPLILDRSAVQSAYDENPENSAFSLAGGE